MIVILPIKSGPRWAPLAPSGYAAELQGAELAVGYRLKNLSNIMEPIIAEHAMGRADQATTRLGIKAALTANGKLPYFEIDGVRQELDSEWLDVAIKTNTDIVCGYRSFVQGIDPEMLDAYPARELVKARNGEEPYDWKARWAESDGHLYNEPDDRPQERSHMAEDQRPWTPAPAVCVRERHGRGRCQPSRCRGTPVDRLAQRHPSCSLPHLRQ